MKTGTVPFSYLVKLHTWKEDPQAKKVELEIIHEEVICDNHDAISDMLGEHFPVFEAAKEIAELDNKPVGPQGILIMGELVFYKYDTACGIEHDMKVDVQAYLHWDIPLNHFNALVDSINAATHKENDTTQFI